MAEEKYPTWLEGHIKRYEHKRLPNVTLCSSSGNDLLEVYYYGDMFQVKGESQPYIGATDAAPLLIVAKDSRSDEEFVVFDEGKHGYNSMVCESFDATQMSERKLTRLDIPASTAHAVKSLVQHVAVLGFFVLDGLVGTKLIGWTYTLALGGMLGTYLSMRGTLLHLLIGSCISLSVDTVSSS